jgi:hypothetical protein
LGFFKGSDFFDKNGKKFSL